jgi:SOS-response transcriptional repressor LexA
VTGKPNREMTTTQKLAWDAYKRFEKKERRAPSVREFMAAIGSASFGGAQRLLEIFRTRGLIKPPRVITETRITMKGRKAQ